MIILKMRSETQEKWDIMYLQINFLLIFWFSFPKPSTKSICFSKNCLVFLKFSDLSNIKKEKVRA